MLFLQVLVLISQMILNTSINITTLLLTWQGVSLAGTVGERWSITSRYRRNFISHGISFGNLASFTMASLAICTICS